MSTYTTTLQALPTRSKGGFLSSIDGRPSLLGFAVWIWADRGIGRRAEASCLGLWTIPSV